MTAITPRRQRMATLEVLGLKFTFPASIWSIFGIVVALCVMICVVVICFVAGPADNVERIGNMFRKPEAPALKQSPAPARIELLDMAEEAVMAPEPMLDKGAD